MYIKYISDRIADCKVVIHMAAVHDSFSTLNIRILARKFSTAQHNFQISSKLEKISIGS